MYTVYTHTQTHTHTNTHIYIYVNTQGCKQAIRIRMLRIKFDPTANQFCF